MPTILSKLGLTQTELDDAINDIPNVPSRLLGSGMFRQKNLTTTSVMVEFTGKQLNLIPNRSRNDAPNLKAFGKGSLVRTFTPTHLNLETTIRPNQIQDVRKAGTKDALLSNAEVISDELAEHRGNHDLTLEHLMLGAVKGKIVDADGSTVIYDLYREFGITAASTAMPFGTAAADLGLLIEQTERAMKKGLNGDVSNGCTVLCSPEFFDALVSHKSAKGAFNRFQDTVLQRDNTNGKFSWRGVDFEIYDYELGGKPLIASGQAHGFLRGMRRGFVQYNAPGNMMAQANKIARPFYVSVENEDHDRGVNIYTESNPLPLCLRPQTLMKFTTA